MMTKANTDVQHDAHLNIEWCVVTGPAPGGSDLATGPLFSCPGLGTPSSSVNSVGLIPSSRLGKVLVTRVSLIVFSAEPGPSSSICALGLNSPGLNLPAPGPLICCRNSTGMGKMFLLLPDLGCAACSDLGS